MAANGPSGGEGTRWAARAAAYVVLALISVAAVVGTVFEFDNWRTARESVHILNDYSPGTYLAASAVLALLAVLSLTGLYLLWRGRARGSRA